jgi:hypothetical protein
MPECQTPSCLGDRRVKETELATMMKCGIGLSLLAVGLLSYSVFWQAPSMRADFAKEINRLDDADRSIQSDIERMGLRISALEGK